LDFIFNFLKRGNRTEQNRTKADKKQTKADKTKQNRTEQNKQINERAEHTDKRADKGLGVTRN